MEEPSSSSETLFISCYFTLYAVLFWLLFYEFPFLSMFEIFYLLFLGVISRIVPLLKGNGGFCDSNSGISS